MVGGGLVWASVSLKDLRDHVRRVLDALRQGDLDTARLRLGWVVGRETARLDATGVVRAALETLSESLCDGVVAPLFFIVAFGPAGGLAYRAANTLDSMLGYRHPPYTHVGFWPARIDDVLSWVPARLSLVFVAAGALVRGRDHLSAWRVGLRDHGLSKSPNSGWPEAALAGALGVSLLGPAVYAGRLMDKPFLNAAARPPEPADLVLGLAVIQAAGLLAYAAALALAGLA